MPWESAAPFVLITGCVWAMSEILVGSQKLAYGRPRATGLDQWDRGLAERDLRFAKSWEAWLKDHAGQSPFSSQPSRVKDDAIRKVSV